MKKRVLFFAVVAMFAALGWAKPELVVQEGHSGSVGRVKYSADGKHLFSDGEKFIKIWDVESSLLLKTIPAKKGDMSPNGKLCVYDSNDGKLFAYSIDTEKSTAFGEGSVYGVRLINDIVFSPDGRYIAVSVIYGRNEIDEIIVYNASNFTKMYTLKSQDYEQSEGLLFNKNSSFLYCVVSKTGDKKDLYNNIVVRWNLYDKRIDNAVDLGKSWCKVLDVNSYGDTFASARGNEDFIVYNFNSKRCLINESIRTKNLETVLGARFSQNDNDVTAVTSKEMLVYNLSTGRKTSSSSIKKMPSLVSSLSFSYDGKTYAVGAYNDVLVFSSYTNDLMAKFSGVSNIRKIVNLPNLDSFYVSTKPYTFNYSLEAFPFFDVKAIKKKVEDVSDSVVELGVSERGCLCGTVDDGVYFYSFKDKSIKKLFDIKEFSDTYEILPNSSDRLVGLQSDDKIYVYQDGIFKGKLKSTDKGYDFISPGGKYIVSPDSANLDSYIHSLYKNRLLPKIFPENLHDISFSKDDAYAALPGEEDGNVCVYDTLSWRIVKKFEGYGNSYFSSTGKYFVVDNVGSYSIYDFYSQKKLFIISSESNILSVFFNSDDTKLFCLSVSGVVSCYSMKSGRLLAKTVADFNGDWLTYTPEGYFNGSEDGIQKFVHMVDGMKVSELGQYAEVLFRPDFVAAKLRGEDISAQYELESLSDITATGDAPLVRFVNPPASSASRDVNVSFIVQDQGGGVGGVYITLNGKVIQVAEASRRIEAVGASQKSAGKTFSFAQPLTLQNGENLIEAYADNAAGKIQSRRASAKITWKGSVSKPSLHVLSVGVNKYRDKSLWLQYSVPDAQAVAQAFAGQKTSLYQNVYTYQLLDGDVTKENLLAQFNAISSKVAADDVFVLFVAGHGTAHQKTGDYYFLPANFRYTDSEAIASQGVSKDDILKYMKNIKAGKTLIMLDTCNSGAFTNDKAMRGVAEKTALDRLCHSTGQAILTAASEEQSAMEGYNGHGIFTYVLLEALSGKADRNKDGYITLNELASYIDEQVPELSYQKWGYEQVPMKELRKQDFPLVGK